MFSTLEILFSLLIINIFFFSTGKFFLKIRINSFQKYLICSLVGSIILSLIGLYGHFFSNLSFFFNTTILIIFLLFFLLTFYKNNFISNIKIIKYIAILTSFSFFLIYAANSNRPDSGLYHYPYIGYLNFEKIIFGISNVNFRFGSISIIQYLQALLNNSFFNQNGMLYPIAILPSIIYLFFVSELLLNLKKMRYHLYTLFLFFSLIFFTYKMNRYSAFGNDYIGHYLFFFVVGIFFKFKYRSNFFILSLLSVFTFLNKVIFFNVFFFSLIILINNFKKKYIYQSILPSILIVGWLIKNIISTGCLIWPLQASCITQLNWHNKNENSYHYVKNVKSLDEAWSKGWPDQNKINDHNKFIKNFNWFSTWIKNHGTKVLKIFFIYFLILLFFTIIFSLNLNKKIKFKLMQKNVTKNYLPILIICFIGFLAWLNYYPVFRFGINSIAILFVVLFIFINKHFIITNKTKNILLLSALFCLTIFIGKNSVKIYKYAKLNGSNNLPLYQSFDKNKSIQYLEKYNDNNIFLYLYTKDLCMYVNKICSNNEIDKNIKLTNFYSYKKFYFND